MESRATNTMLDDRNCATGKEIPRELVSVLVLSDLAGYVPWPLTLAVQYLVKCQSGQVPGEVELNKPRYDT